MEKAIQESIMYSQPTQSNNMLYITGMIVIGLCTMLAMSKL